MADVPIVARMVRYPIKGFSGQSVSHALLCPSAGVPYDRGFAITNGQAPDGATGEWAAPFGFVRLTKNSDLPTFEVDLDADAGTLTLTHPVRGRIMVTLDDPDSFAVANGELAGWFDTGRFGPPRLVRAGHPFWDEPEGQLSLINLESLNEISAAVGQPLDPERFRGNLYLADLPAWAEWEWIGRRMKLGEAEIEILHPIDRCRATTINPLTAESDLNVPAELAKRFGHLYCGVRARVVEAGVVRPGDQLTATGVRNRPGKPQYGPASTQWPRPAEVVRKEIESASVTSVWLRDPLADFRAPVRPGHHIRVHLSDSDGPLWRAYTVSAVDGDLLRISVKREDPYGRGSRLLHETSPIGGTVRISGPHGAMVLDQEPARPLLLISAGIGITPILAMLRSAAESQPDRPILVCHVARDGDHLALWSEARALIDKLRSARAELFLTRPRPRDLSTWSATESRPDIGTLVTAQLADQNLNPADSVAYVCGPTMFMRDTESSLIRAGIAPHNLHYEVFASPSTHSTEPAPPPKPGPFQVSFAASGETAEWTPASGTLLDLAESVGLNPPSGCRSGACQLCQHPLRAGETAYTTEPTLTPPGDSVLLCCAVPTSDLTLDA